jgi:hypothetical protein
MGKRVAMLAMMAALFGASTACFGLFQDDSKRPASSDPCAGLIGQERIDCESRAAGQGG